MKLHDKCPQCGATPPLFPSQPCACGYRIRARKPPSIHRRAFKFAAWHFLVTILVVWLGAGALSDRSYTLAAPERSDTPNGFFVLLAPVASLPYLLGIDLKLDRGSALLFILFGVIASGLLYGYAFLAIKGKVA